LLQANELQEDEGQKDGSKYHSAWIPQTLTLDEWEDKFRLTTYQKGIALAALEAQQ
jgi:hypothetical protein